MFANRSAARRLSRAELLLLLAILIAAAALRLYRLDEIPPGLTHDEAGHAHDAASVLAGFRPIYFTVGYGREPLFDYFSAGLMAALGRGLLTLRLSAVFWGMLTVVVAYLWTRATFGAATALGSAALMAVSFWPLAVSRQGLRSGALPAVFGLAVWFFWELVRRQASVVSRQSPVVSSQSPVVSSQSSVASRQSSAASRQSSAASRQSPDAMRHWSLVIGHWSFVIRTLPTIHFLLTTAFALAVAASLYTYLPARGLWLVFPCFLGYLSFFHRRLFNRLWLPTLSGLGLAALLAAPLFAYLRTHPGAEQRLDMLDAPLRALAAGEVLPLLTNAWEAARMIVVPGAGDHFLAYTIPGRPIFDPITFALFAAGLALCLRRIRRPECALLLLWLLAGLSPSLLTGPQASTTRALGALIPIYVLPVLVVREVSLLGARLRDLPRGGPWADFDEPHPAKVVGLGPWLAFACVLVITAVGTYRDYFERWGESPDVRAAYQRTIVEIARYLDARPTAGPATISSLYPAAPHDPYVAEAVLAGERPALRWADGQSALVFPDAGAARLLVPSSAPLDPLFAPIVEGLPRERVSLRPDDLDPYFDVYMWNPRAAFDGLLASSGAPPPANFANALELLGARWLDAPARAGGAARLVTLWRVLDPERVGPRVPPAHETDVVVFTHVLDGTGGILAQRDSLDAPSWDWQAGDGIAQIHALPLPVNTAPGRYEVEVGVYDRASGERLPLVAAGEEIVGDRAVVAPLEVVAP